MSRYRGLHAPSVSVSRRIVTHGCHAPADASASRTVRGSGYQPARLPRAGIAAPYRPNAARRLVGRLGENHPWGICGDNIRFHTFACSHAHATRPRRVGEAGPCRPSRLPDRQTQRCAKRVGDFAQLVDWFNYLLPRLTIGAAMADKDESINRIRFTVTSSAVRDSLVRAVSALSVPCDLVVIEYQRQVERRRLSATATT